MTGLDKTLIFLIALTFFIDAVLFGYLVHQKNSFEICLGIGLVKRLAGLDAGDHDSVGIPGPPVILGLEGISHSGRREVFGRIALSRFKLLIFQTDVAVTAGT